MILRQEGKKDVFVLIMKIIGDVWCNILILSCVVDSHSPKVG